MVRNFTPTVCVILISLTRTVQADIIHVPGDETTIQAAINAANNGDEVVVADGVYTGPGNKNLDFGGKSITVRSANGPGNCIIDCQNDGRGFYFHSDETSAYVDGFTITRGNTVGLPEPLYRGAGMHISDSHPLVSNCVFNANSAEIGGAVAMQASGDAVFSGCTFSDNHANGPGGAMDIRDGSWALAVDCTFTDNVAAGGGAIFTYSYVSAPNSDPTDLMLINCTFSGNQAMTCGGALYPASDVLQDTALLINCAFVGNSAPLCGGAIAFTNYGETSVTNCIFSQNSSVEGGGVLSTGDLSMNNCTFSNNSGGGLWAAAFDGPAQVVVSNCILWGNTPIQIYDWDTATEVSFSDVQGGWPGVGNIDADPLFVQPGTDNLRLAFGSPCLNAGSNAALPPDNFDLDVDGDMTEPISLDLDGEPRIQDGVVDLGAFEGANDALPPGDGDDDFDQGEFIALAPCGGPLDLLNLPSAFVGNQSGPDNATFNVSCINWELHPGAGGFSELEAILAAQTTLEAGDFSMTIAIPFDEATLAGDDPMSLNLTVFDPESSNWRLAVGGNSQNSPNHDGPIGDRITVQNTNNNFGLTNQLGDYGVFWNPALKKGFAWAIVDHVGDFALGATLCATDCQPSGGDGIVDARDLQALLGIWGPDGGGSGCDFVSDGVINASDLALLLGEWGQCEAAPNASLPQPPGGFPTLCQAVGACHADLNRDGLVDVRDSAVLLGWWGDCPPSGECSPDLNEDGIVNTDDLSAWREMLTIGERSDRK